MHRRWYDIARRYDTHDLRFSERGFFSGALTPPA